MYKIYADDTVIYDSTFEDYKIGKGQITLEANKSGSFVFSVYPDHFYFDDFIRMKTVITVYKSNRIVFRGRILNDVTDYWNNKVITCEGEMGFLQDSIIRPFDFSGTPEELFRKFIEEHNAQVDDFKCFKIGTVTVVDSNNYIARSNEGYTTTFENLNSRLPNSALGGNFYITHGADGTDPIPTLNYLADFPTVSTQSIEFGSNLKDYTKTAKAEDIATAIIPIGAEIGESGSGKKLTIADINNGVDYVYNKTAVELYGWITKMVEWQDVTEAENLKKKAEAYVRESIKQSITIELTAVDLHLLDRSIESFKMGDYIPVYSKPHNFDDVMLCTKQTIDLLKPDNDTVTLGHTFMTFTEKNSELFPTITKVKVIESTVQKVNTQIAELDGTVGNITGDVSSVVETVSENTKNISRNTESISNNSKAIEKNSKEIEGLVTKVSGYDTAINSVTQEVQMQNGKIEDISKAVEGQTEIISALAEQVVKQSEVVTTLSETVTKQEENIKSILERLTKLETLDVDGGYPS